jgi:AcrR family transcriptional regulator
MARARSTTQRGAEPEALEAPTVKVRRGARSASGAAAEPTSRRAAAEQTRDRIQDAALTLIRKKGFDATTMRDIAQAAHVSLGLAYHYFDSKEALALAFYGEHIARHDDETRRALATRPGLRERIEAALLIGLDVRAADRPVLLVMARTVLDAANPISLFSEETRALRARSIGLFREVAEVPELDDSLKEPMALALWGLHLGILLRFVHDDSPGQKQTRALVEGSAKLAAEIATMLSLPLLESMRNDLLEVLRGGGLLGALEGQGPGGHGGPSTRSPENGAEGHGTTRTDATLEREPDPARPRPRGRQRLQRS